MELILFVLFLVWLVGSLGGMAMAADCGNFDDLKTPYGIIGLLPGWILLIPFYLLRMLVRTNYGQAFHKFMSTPINELVKIKVTFGE